MIRIGILSVQGAVAEHERAVLAALESNDIDGTAVHVRDAAGLASSDAMIIPGGESTTISKLIEKAGLAAPLRKRAADEGLPVMGTCAGAVLLAKKADESVRRTGTRLLGLMNCRVARNAFGRQRESFEMPVVINGIASGDDPYPGVFIRAPLILEVYNNCRPLAYMPDGSGILAAQENNIMALVFHPELTADLRVHEYFIRMIK